MARKYNKRVDSKGKIDALRRHMVKKVPVSEGYYKIRSGCFVAMDETYD